MVTREFELGSIYGLPEFRITMNDTGSVPMPVVQTRSTTIRAFVVINQLDDVGEDFWNAVRDCVMLAGAGAGIAGFFAGGVATVPIFLQVFGTCATSKGFNLVSSQVQLRTETTSGEWDYSNPT